MAVNLGLRSAQRQADTMTRRMAPINYRGRRGCVKGSKVRRQGSGKGTMWCRSDNSSSWGVRARNVRDESNDPRSFWCVLIKRPVATLQVRLARFCSVDAYHLLDTAGCPEQVVALLIMHLPCAKPR